MKYWGGFEKEKAEYKHRRVDSTTDDYAFNRVVR